MSFKPFCFQSALNQLAQENLIRERQVIESPQGAEVVIGGERLLNFCSNDYLGMAADERLRAALIQGVDRCGVGSGASHLVCGHHAAHHDLEQALAEWVGRPRALLFSTGYMANLGAIQALVGRHDVVFEDRLNHASLIDGGLLSGARFHRYPHLDLVALSKQLEKVSSQLETAKALIVTDSLFSMDGDVATVKELAHLANQFAANLMVDEAHALGVIGEKGEGVVAAANLDSNDVPVIVGTMGKALGCFGAFVAGNADLIEYLKQKTRTSIYTTAMPPSLCVAAMKSVELVRDASDRREALMSNIHYFKQCAEKYEMPLLASDSAIQPLMLGSAVRALNWSEHLRKRKIMVSAIRPPTVAPNTARLRITLTALHTETMLDQLFEALSDIKRMER